MCVCVCVLHVTYYGDLYLNNVAKQLNVGEVIGAKSMLGN